MATRTDKLGLIKPSYDDTIDVQNLNDNSDIIDSEIYKRLKTTGDTMTGNISFSGGSGLKVQTDNAFKLEGYNNNSYIELNNNGIIYTSGVIQTNSSEISLRSNSGTNFAINDNGYAYLEGSSIWSDKFINGESSLSNDCKLVWNYYKVSQTTVIMTLCINNPNNYSGTIDITYPIPFRDTSYYAVNGCENNNNDSDIRINGDFRHNITRKTTTGCQVATDNLVNSVLLIIGRV